MWSKTCRALSSEINGSAPDGWMDGWVPLMNYETVHGVAHFQPMATQQRWRCDATSSVTPPAIATNSTGAGCLPLLVHRPSPTEIYFSPTKAAA